MAFVCGRAQAEEPVGNFSFVGYKVILILSDTFCVEVKNPDLRMQERKDGPLALTFKGANEPMPKDVEHIYTKMFAESDGLILD